jgi:hypothetical protein
VYRLEQLGGARVQIETSMVRLAPSPAKSLFTFLGRPSLSSLS